MRKYLSTLSLAWILLAISAWAQGYGANVNVRFPFVVNRISFPAGVYDIRGLSGPESYLTIENRQTHQKAFVQFRHVALTPGKRQADTTLIFTTDGKQYVPHQVRVNGDFHTHDIIHMSIAEPPIDPSQ